MKAGIANIEVSLGSRWIWNLIINRLRTFITYEYDLDAQSRS